jgi:hypothetical protein|eukprot:scaffold324_cov188-Alexandrium_tamarense.AAC.21
MADVDVNDDVSGDVGNEEGGVSGAARAVASIRRDSDVRPAASSRRTASATSTISTQHDTAAPKLHHQRLTIYQ